MARVQRRLILDDDGGKVEAGDLGHPRHGGDTRDEIELFIRDAYASGCNAARNQSLLTAVEYAHRHAPDLRKRLADIAARETGREPIAWLRSLDGTDSYHPCSAGDPGAFPVYAD